MTITSPFKSGILEFDREAVLRDYRVGIRSRHTSVIGRQEVLTGRGKFGIFGDGKEVAQLALAYAFRKGDFRSGYYRDQTFMMALGLLPVQQLFAQLYAHAEPAAEPAFGGRSMTGHFGTRLLDSEGRWLSQVDRYNSAADLSPTAAQMPRTVGLAYASKLYRQLPDLASVAEKFSRNGDEIVFATIGNASCAEGLFWEAVNALGVIQAPAVISIWDDGYGISVPNRFQMTKNDVSSALGGFGREPGGKGFDLYRVEGWNYAALCETYLRASAACRREHVPAIVHVTELTQPQGHSTSGSHERYKSPERLEWEREYDCMRQMREWILAQGIARRDELEEIEEQERSEVIEARDRAWEAYRDWVDADAVELDGLLQAQALDESGAVAERIHDLARTLGRRPQILRRDLLAASQAALAATLGSDAPSRRRVAEWHRRCIGEGVRRYDSNLVSETGASALLVPAIAPRYSDGAVELNAFEILNAGFDAAFARCPQLMAMGEDIGQLGDVNQGLAHLQEKYGDLRIADTGIREATILGQAIGLALRGLRPIAEIQYLDYILYALQIMSDDLASLRWRTVGGQAAPVIIRTRGHRLEGIWHSGSPMAGVINLLRGIHVCVPRNAVQAVGMYNTLLRSDDAGLVVEVLNGYRRKERLPSNIGELTTPLGVAEILREGGDVTVVTYGACCAIALAAAVELESLGVDCEVVDAQTLLPFDREARIARSIEKTSRVLFLDEDVPGGASAFMMQQVLEEQQAFQWLDGPPRTLTSRAHRPAYGSDGDYFSKPNREQIVSTVYAMMRESDPATFPELI